MAPSVTALDHLVLTVTDIGKTVSYYTDVLGMQADVFHPTDGSTRWALTFGSQKINLHPKGKEFDPKAQVPTVGSGDLCFLSNTSLSDWIDHLHEHGIAIEEDPIDRTGATGPIRSIYIRDPDGNLLEIANHL